MIPLDNLFIDVSFILLFIFALIFIINYQSIKSYILNKLSIASVSHSNINELPNIDHLLELEKTSRNLGSNITFDSLIATWKFVFVYRKGTNSNQILLSYLLRLFSATLVIDKNPSIDTEFPLKIVNSIKFGFLSLKFIGRGNLQGKQPLLSFFFEKIQLEVSSNIFFTKTIPKPENNNKPYLALIELDKCSGWLSARGRGGGLAVWVCN